MCFWVRLMVRSSDWPKSTDRWRTMQRLTSGFSRISCSTTSIGNVATTELSNAVANVR